MSARLTRPFSKLTQSFKRRFAFRLSVPSFIYPAGYVDNVTLLAPYVDEIELLLFESGDGSLPSPSEIEVLASLAADHDISYNIHLPTDLELCAPSSADRQKTLERLCKVIDRVRPLCPTTHTLHLPYQPEDRQRLSVADWAACHSENLSVLLSASRLHPRQISIETIDYPPAWFDSLVKAMDLTVCLDIGHALRYGYDLEATFKLYEGHIAMIHLHSVISDRDHLSLDMMGTEDQQRVQSCLGRYTHGLSLEVFSFERLAASLACLDRMFPKMAAVQTPCV